MLQTVVVYIVLISDISLSEVSFLVYFFKDLKLFHISFSCIFEYCCVIVYIYTLNTGCVTVCIVMWLFYIPGCVLCSFVLDLAAQLHCLHVTVTVLRKKNVHMHRMLQYQFILAGELVFSL